MPFRNVNYKKRMSVYHRYFSELEGFSDQAKVQLHEVIDHLSFNDVGLIPVITQDAENHAVLMMAWMNREALEITLQTGRMTYWSRSRQKLWKKGESSGHLQTLVSINVDCDGDSILCRVRQFGSACHTYRKTCFYLEVDREEQTVTVLGDGFSK